MALEMGLGVTPWSPLKGGLLTGKYTRDNAGKVTSARGDWVHGAFNETNYKIVDELIRVSKEVNSTPARVALAWLQGQAGVTSSIIGSTSLAQLDDNLAALDLKLSHEQMKALDQVSQPKLNFPAEFLKRSGSFQAGGTTINGETNPLNPIAPKSDKERFDKARLVASK